MLERFRKRNENQLTIERSFTNDGVQFRIVRTQDGNQFNCSLPLEQISISDLIQSGALSMIEGLELAYSDDKLSWDENTQSFILSYDKVYETDDYILNRLALANGISSVQVQLESKAAIGMKEFEIISRITSDVHGNLTRFAERHGPFYQLPNGTTLLMPKEAYRLLSLIEARPVELEDQFEYIAKVKQLAHEAGATLNEALRKEEYVLMDKHDIAVNIVDPTLIELSPRYIPSSLGSSADEATVNKMAKEAERYNVDTSGGHRKRYIASKKAHQAVKKLHSHPSITGADVPRFVENPAAFLSEDELSDEFLEAFGERVKGLGLRVYQSRPYVSVNKDNRGYFDVDFGFHLEPIATGLNQNNNIDSDKQSEGSQRYEPEATHEETSDNISVNEFANLVEEARDKGEEYVLWKGSWVKIPDNADSFIQRIKGNPELQKGQMLDPTRLPYVLEIFTNIEALEYDRSILDALAELSASDLLEAPPAYFNATLYDYQKDGFRWLKKINHHRIGGLLADDMGLGKTVQVIAFFASLKDKGELQPSLIVAPLTLLDNWGKEILRFCPSIQVYKHQGDSRVRTTELLGKSEVVLTSYDTLARDQLLLAQVNWKVVVCDESQNIKNPSTAKATAVKALKNQVRVAMTGTPVENGLSELWSIMDFVQPGLLGSLTEFRKMYEKPILQQDESLEKIREIEMDLLHKIQPVYLRRTKSEHLKDRLPKKHILPPEKVSLSNLQQQMYQEVVDKVRQKEISALAGIARLKQICAHPGLCERNYEGLHWSEVPKLNQTIKIFEHIRDNGEKALIFTEFIQMQTILQRTISEHFGIRPRIINGSVNGRQDIVDDFNSRTGFDVLVLSPKAAGVGLTITGANHVIHYTRWWNPAVENQATDRAYRIGQTKDVHVYFPIVTLEVGDTLEMIVHEILAAKSQLADSIIVPSKQLEISQNELEKKVFGT